MSKVKPVGEVIYPNKKGFFDSGIDQSQPLQKIWQKPVWLSVQEVQKHLPNLISSIYIRGSVARDTALSNISDIDLVVVTKNELQVKTGNDWMRAFRKELKNKHPQVDDIDIEIVSLPSLLNLKKHNGIRVLLALQGKWLIGDHILYQFPKIGPDASSFVHIPSFSKYQARLNNTLKTKDVFLPVFIPWVAKRYIRTGFELCIEKEKAFTRDLYYCFDIFSKYYPSKKDDMYQVLEQAIRPSWAKEDLIKCVNNLGEWLQSEINKNYPQYK